MDPDQLRYKVWEIKFILPTFRDKVDLDYVELICSQCFSEYYIVDTSAQHISKAYAIT
jgi:hypothetical protein